MNREIIVQTQDLIRSFEFGETEVLALNGVDFEVFRGEFVCVLGPSGAGKTTLLNMIGGIDYPSSGKVIVDQKIISEYKKDELNDYRRDSVGWVFQFFNIVASLRAWENVGLALEFQGMEDNLVPIKGVRSFFEQISIKDKTLIELPEAYHSLFSDPAMNGKDGWEKLRSWISSH